MGGERKSEKSVLSSKLDNNNDDDDRFAKHFLFDFFLFFNAEWNSLFFLSTKNAIH